MLPLFIKGIKNGLRKLVVFTKKIRAKLNPISKILYSQKNFLFLYITLIFKKTWLKLAPIYIKILFQAANMGNNLLVKLKPIYNRCYLKLSGIISPIIFIVKKILEKFCLKAKIRFAGGATIATFLSILMIAASGYNTQQVVAVEQNGEVVAYIKDEETYEEAKNIIAEQFVDVPVEKAEIKPIPAITSPHKLVETSVPQNTPIEDKTQLAETLLQNANQDVIIATGLYIDESFYGSTTDGDFLNDTLNKIKSSYAEEQGVSIDAVSIKNNIALREGVYLTNSIQEGEVLASKMQGTILAQEIYTVLEGDTIISISETTGVDYDTIISLNPGLDEFNIHPGDSIILEKEKPLISLSAVKEVQYQQEVPYYQEKQESPNLEEGITNILEPGENGLVDIVAQIEIVDGVEVASTIISEETIKAVVPEKVEVGTKEIGDLIRPMKSGYVSQGYTSAFDPDHGAVDIAAPTGTPVYASAGGTVTTVACDSDGYGNYMIIDHGNGMKTLYAHLSKIEMCEGQKVHQNDQIGLVGNTGRSTGPHLHFEVRIKNQKVNPFNYCEI